MSTAASPTSGRPASRPRGPRHLPPICVTLAYLALAAATAPSLADTPRPGALAMPAPHAGSLLVGYYEAYLKDQDLDAFRARVEARYEEATLARLLQAGDTGARRAAVFSLGLCGSISANGAVAESLRDVDPTVRNLADIALWAIWSRADTDENNHALDLVRAMVGRKRYASAVEAAGELIARAPRFAEAYNQRAIAYFFLGKLDESIADCGRVLQLNPYHFGALQGMGQCHLRLGHRAEALETFRRALKLQPFSEGLRETVSALEENGG